YAPDPPLRLAKQTQDLAQIVNQTGEDEPPWMAVSANCLCRLHQVFDLAEIGIGIAVIHERVEKLHRLPHAHPPFSQRQILALLLPDEIERLIAVIQPI